MNSFSIRITFLLIFSFFSHFIYAGGVRGTISNEKGEALSYASIYVQEIKTGTTTNIDGQYELQLKPGNYTLVFQYLGYESVQKQLVINNDITNLDIVLKQQVLSLSEVEILDGRENPAYTIIRKAIAKSKFHLNQLDAYSAQVYVKGSGRLNKIPWLFRSQLKKEGIDTTSAFVSESISEVSFKRPNTFSERIISVYEKGDNNFTDPGGFINGSFYLPRVNSAVSPLSPRSFAYYRFEFLGSFFDQGIEVNKIKVIPRSKGENVFEGELNIVDGIWTIHSLNLKTRIEGFNYSVRQTYKAIQEQVWLPVNHTFKISGKVFGLGFSYTYLATNANYKISLNPDLDYDFSVVDEKIEKEKAKSLDLQLIKNKELAIEKRLSSGKEITKKELEKVLKDYEKEARKTTKEPAIVRIENYTVDSLAEKRDPDYWNTIRPIPLNKYEVRSYEIRDSIYVVEKEGNDKETGEESIQRQRFAWYDILLGKSYHFNNYTFRIHPPINSINFNTVEGFNLDYTLSLRKKYNNNFSASIGTTARYAFTRERLNGKGFLQFDFGKNLKKGFFRVEGGRYIFQYNNQDPISPQVNTFYTLLEEENFMKIYEKDFVALQFEKQVWANLNLTLGLEWSNRFLLENNSSGQVWVDRENVSYSSNIPFDLNSKDFSFLQTASSNKASIASIGIEYKPWQQYKLFNGIKQILNKKTPSFSLRYRKAFAGLLESTVNFDHLEFGFRHEFKIGAYDDLHFKTQIGTFLNQEDSEIAFMDYKHFLGNQTIFVTTDPVGNFRLLDYYDHSTRQFYLAAHAHYHFRKFLFTRIPVIQLLGIKENLFVNTLYTDAFDQYTEIGYGIDKIYKIFRLEFIGSFKETTFQNFGIRIGVASSLDLGL